MTSNHDHPALHGHSFGQERRRPGEVRTIIVIAITAAMMLVEIVAGTLYGSMALLADGLHMASHAAALSINAFAYIYARRHAHDERFSFGTGKVNTLGGFTGAVLLAGFALAMALESIHRLIDPVAIAFNQAIFVAVVGLVVNGVSVLILGQQHGAAPGHDHADDGHGRGHEHNDGHGHDDHHHHHHHDHNLISAYLHVLADALTSVLAIFALLAAKYFGLNWADPLMGIVGAVLVARWSLGLLRSTSVVLLDQQGPEPICRAVRHAIEADGDSRVVDLHVWAVGPGIYSAIIAVTTTGPQDIGYYRTALPGNLGIVHVSIEIHRHRNA